MQSHLPKRTSAIAVVGNSLPQTMHPFRGRVILGFVVAPRVAPVVFDLVTGINLTPVSGEPAPAVHPRSP